MEKMITHDPQALRFLMTDDIYLLEESLVPSVPLMKKSETITEETPLAIPISKAPSDIPILQKDEIKETVTFDYLGENNRYFLILVEDQTHIHLNTAHKEMLMKIMGAKKLEMRDLAILNLAKYPKATFSQLRDFFSCNKLSLFGIDPQRLSLPLIPANEPFKQDGVKVLTTFSLDEMSTNTDKKRQFWTIMKDF